MGGPVVVSAVDFIVVHRASLAAHSDEVAFQMFAFVGRDK